MRTTFHFLSVLGATLTLGTAAALPLIDVSTGTPSVAVGSRFEVTIDVLSIADLYAYEFDVGFDPHVLRVDRVREGPLLAGYGATYFLAGLAEAGAGRVDGIADTLLTEVPGAAGSGELVTLDFTAIGTGSSSVSLDGLQLLDSACNPIAADTAATSIRVTPAARVPEPLAMSLLGPALLALLRRRNGSRA